MIEYNKSFRKTIIAFLDIFNDIYVNKYNNQGEIDKTVKVPIKFAPKEKFYLWLYDRNHIKPLPIMASEITNIEYDEARKTGKHENVTIKTESDEIEYYRIPSPYNISFQLKIATQYLNEMEQIVSQFLPYFDPFVYTTIDMVDFDDKWNISISFQSMSLDQSSTYGNDELRNVIWDFDFIARTYIIRPQQNIKTVKSVINKFFINDSSWENRTSASEIISGGNYSISTGLIKGKLDEDSQIIHTYEIFE